MRRCRPRRRRRRRTGPPPARGHPLAKAVLALARDPFGLIGAFGHPVELGRRDGAPRQCEIEYTDGLRTTVNFDAVSVSLGLGGILSSRRGERRTHRRGEAGGLAAAIEKAVPRVVLQHQLEIQTRFPEVDPLKVEIGIDGEIAAGPAEGVPRAAVIGRQRDPGRIVEAVELDGEVKGAVPDGALRAEEEVRAGTRARRGRRRSPRRWGRSPASAPARPRASRHPG